MKIRRSKSSGIALFILLTSLIIISFGMAELIQSSNHQASRVRNYGDRLEALYIARSTTNLARALFLLDSAQKKYGNAAKQADTPSDLWAQPIPFPIPSSMIRLLTEKAMGEAPQSASDKESLQSFFKKCDDFFEDFGGQAQAKISDLNSLLYLNNLDEREDPQRDQFGVLENLLKPSFEFERSLTARGLDAETIARQIRDYIDRDQEENISKIAEDGPYQSLQLEYGPKNQPILLPEELSLIPSVDDEVFDYLTQYVTTGYLPITSRKRGKINLNTVNPTLFQALLKNVSNPNAIAQAFVKHRTDKKFVYTDENIQRGALKENIGLDSENIRTILLTGISDAFKIETDVTVNQIKLRLEATITRTPGTVKAEPIQLTRVSP